MLRCAGGLAESTEFTREHGGETALAAMACAALGVDTAFVTRVGDDPFGQWLLKTWDSAGVHLDYVCHSPGRNIVSLGSERIDGGAPVVWSEGAAPTGLEPEDLDGVPWELTRVVYASGTTQALGDRPAQTALSAFNSARRAGALTVYRPALRDAHWPPNITGAARAAFDQIVPQTDVLVLEAPFEAGRLLGQPTAEKALDAAARRGVTRAIVSLGVRGLHMMERGERKQVSHSGDLSESMGMILAGLATGKSLFEAADPGLTPDGGAKK
jgi:sugar/nucleoside kinase (ribokinase family)